MKQKIRKSFLLALGMLIFYQITVSKVYQSRPQFQDNTFFKQKNKVVIGSVYCRPENISILKDKYFDQTVVMLKSALISAHLYNISTLEIHLFLEHTKDQKYFQEEVLKKMAIPGVTVNLELHSAVDKVPKGLRDHMIYHHRFRCGYVRFYFPKALSHVDSIIYLDLDMIVTGDLMEYWKLLAKMDSKQLVAVGQDSPPENEKYWSSYHNFFKAAPHVPPRGINSGLLVMNLTRMREFGMSEKIARLSKDYSKVTKVLSDQVVLNVLLYFNPGLMLLINCNFNFMGPECENGAFYCQHALEDPDGIHVVHGNSHRFLNGMAFYPIYKFFKKFNVSTLPGSSIVNNLMKPIRQAYSTELGENKKKCSGALAKVLFRRFVHSN